MQETFMRKTSPALLGFAAAVALAAPALAGTLNRASEGWVYFHRAGATPLIHDVAVADCLAAARQMGAPYAGVGILPGLIAGKAQSGAVAPDVENCMVGRGWEVVRLDEAEGAAIGALDQPGQAKALAPWIGSEAVHGTVVRRFERLGSLARIKGMGELFGGRVALSVTAAAPPPPALAPSRQDSKLRFRMAPETDPSKAAPGSAFIVIRLITHALPNAGYALIRFNEPAGEVEAIGAASPVKLFMKTGADLEKTFVFAVAPGRWYYPGPFTVSACLGAPAFDIAAGEVLFAGTFTVGSADPYKPDMALEPARAAMKEDDLKARLRPAAWVNGYSFNCGTIPNELYLDRVDFPGFPSLPDNPPPS
jgi:hypothetical protein